MAEPVVSVIIPVGPRHVALAPQAVASVRWQTVAGCEAIVVNDSGGDIRPENRHPSISYLNTGGGRGPAHARNLGIQAARAPFILPLDADDYLLPGGVEALLRAFVAKQPISYVYGDVYTTTASSPMPALGRTPDYEQAGFAYYNLHVVTALVPTVLARLVGGFDEAVDGFEDWTLYLRLAIVGACGYRTPQMTMVYRTGLGERAKAHARNARDLMDGVLARYTKEGRIPMAPCGSCGGVDGATIAAADGALAAIPPPDARITTASGETRVEFVGLERGSVTYRHPTSGRRYKLGNNAMDHYRNVVDEDLPWLLSVAEVRVVAPVAPFVPPPAVEQPPLVDTPALTPDDDALALVPVTEEVAAAVEPPKSRRTQKLVSE